MDKVVVNCAIIFSFMCLLLALAPFTPAIAGTFIMLILTGFIGFKGFLPSSLLLLLINTLAMIGSPGVDIANADTWIFIFPVFLMAFGGVFIGVKKRMT